MILIKKSKINWPFHNKLSSPTNIEMPWLMTSPKPPIPKTFPFGGTVRGRGTKSGASWRIPPDRGTGHSAQQPLPLPTWPRLPACPRAPRLSVVRPTVGSDGPKGTRGPSEARTARTVDVPNWPFTVQPLVRFHVLSLVDEPAEATSTIPPPRPGSRTHNKSPLPTRGHTHAASTQVSQAVRAAGPSAVGPSSQRRSAPRMKAESVSRPRRHLIPI